MNAGQTEIEIPTPPERRLKMVVVPENTVWFLFRHQALDMQTLTVPVFKNVPADARVAYVHHVWERHAFAFVLEHPSFEPVPQGLQVPEIPAVLSARRIAVEPLEGQ